MKISKAVSLKLQKICVEKELSVNKLAETCMLTQSTVQNVISEQSANPKILTIVRICDGLGIKLKDFFDEDFFDNIDREED